MPPYRIESLIDANGEVTQVQVTPSLGDSTVDSAVVSVAREITYAPATLNGEPICFWLGFAGPRDPFSGA